MSLHLSACVFAREPGFSRSECLDLARKIDLDSESLWDDVECDLPHCEMVVIHHPNLSARERATLIAALLAYAA